MYAYRIWCIEPVNPPGWLGGGSNRWLRACVYSISLVCSVREVFTSHESDGPASNPEWGPICYKASICTGHNPSLHPSGVVHRVPEQRA